MTPITSARIIAKHPNAIMVELQDRKGVITNITLPLAVAESFLRTLAGQLGVKIQ